MRDISIARNKILEKMLQYNKKNGKTSYTSEEERINSLRAELAAFRQQIIPRGYSNFNINSLTGFSKDNEELLSHDVAAKAKKIISHLLWPTIPLEKIRDFDASGEDKIKFCDKSNIEYHRENGTNIMIYGSAHSGKTLCASIIMNHIIDMHISNMQNYGQTYDWVEFSTLQQYLTRQNDEESTYLKSVDWLVIDDINLISGNSIQAKKYITSCLDPFFISRIEDRYPTIFIFAFDLESKQEQEIADSYGLAISRIFSSKETIKIGLS